MYVFGATGKHTQLQTVEALVISTCISFIPNGFLQLFGINAVIHYIPQINSAFCMLPAVKVCSRMAQDTHTCGGVIQR